MPAQQYYIPTPGEAAPFYMLPKAIMEGPVYADLHPEAKLVYTMMLDRVKLSLKNGWQDSDQHTFIYFTQEEIRSVLHCSRSKASALLKELEKANLIRRKHQGLNQPDRIYVMQYDGQTSSPRMIKTNTSGCLNFKHPGACISGTINTENINTNNINTDIHQGVTAEQINICRNYLKHLWGYTALRDHYSDQQLEGIFTLAVEVLCSQEEMIQLGKQAVSKAQIIDRFAAMDFTHIDYVLECMTNSAKRIRNPRSYMLTALYNAPVTIDAYYAAMVSSVA